MPHRLLNLLQAPVDSAVAAASVASLAAAILADAFAPVNVLLLAIWAVAMIVDFAAGITHSVHAGGWESLEFRKFARGLARRIAMFFFYVAALIADALASLVPVVGAASEATPVTKAVLSAIVGWELVSIMRHSKAVTGFALPIHLVMRNVDRGILGEEPPVRRHYDEAALLEEQTLKAKGVLDGEPKP